MFGQGFEPLLLLSNFQKVPINSKVLVRPQSSDVNECEEGTHDCYQKEKCLNVEGGFDCICPDNTACISVLVLMGETWYTPKFIDSMGLDTDWDCFKHSDTYLVHGTCSIVWRSEVYFFGGFYYEDETLDMNILKLSDKTLQFLGVLETFFSYGACG